MTKGAGRASRTQVHDTNALDGWQQIYRAGRRLWAAATPFSMATIHWKGRDQALRAQAERAPVTYVQTSIHLPSRKCTWQERTSPRYPSGVRQWRSNTVAR